MLQFHYSERRHPIEQSNASSRLKGSYAWGKESEPGLWCIYPHAWSSDPNILYSVLRYYAENPHKRSIGTHEFIAMLNTR